MKLEMKTDMKKEGKSPLNKVISVVGILFGLAYIILCILEFADMGNYESIANFCFSIFWMCIGITSWKSNRKSAIWDFVLAAVWLLLAVI